MADGILYACAETEVFFAAVARREGRLFREVGVPVATRTTAPPVMDEAAQAAFLQKATELAPKYRTELLKQAW